MFAISKTCNTAIIPIRATPGSAGYDLSAAENATVEPNTWKAIDTGIAIQIPNDCYARVAPRSGLAFKLGIDVFAGVVDSDYRDSIKVILMNHGTRPFTVASGDRIAQLIFERVYTPDLTEVSYKNLTNTVRGVGGFGSTGV
jgi:dUTP pyrophosphatase